AAAVEDEIERAFELRREDVVHDALDLRFFLLRALLRVFDRGGRDVRRRHVEAALRERDGLRTRARTLIERIALLQFELVERGGEILVELLREPRELLDVAFFVERLPIGEAIRAARNERRLGRRS